jgi:hypothetical protein
MVAPEPPPEPNLIGLALFVVVAAWFIVSWWKEIIIFIFIMFKIIIFIFIMFISSYAVTHHLAKKEEERRVEEWDSPIIISAAAAAALGSAWYIWRSLFTKKEDRQKEERCRISERTYISYSSTNNHDHLKHKHSTREDAESEIRRMKRNGCDGSERLNAYYNSDYKGWYVGRSSWTY